jgi:hypothetical protein
MNPDLEIFLEGTFGKIQPTSAMIGRVVVEPDYDVTQSASDAEQLTSELAELLGSQTPSKESLNTLHGWEVTIPEKYSLLASYLLRITLHSNKVEGPWVEVAPPGNWI